MFFSKPAVQYFRLFFPTSIVGLNSCPTIPHLLLRPSHVKSATENKGPGRGELFPINIKCLGIQENRVNEKPLELRSSQVTISIISLILTSSAISTSFTISIISLIFTC